MISRRNLEQQLHRIHFRSGGWGRSEARELCNILMPDEQIDECVNGFYEAGFALLVVTKDRLLLVDKKPLSYLAVEDMRFDMINEFDYDHRLIGAHVKVSAGAKTLRFTSWNKTRLRRLLNFAQCRMTELKKQQQSHEEAQRAHLEQMNQQLQLFLRIQQYQLYQQQRMAGYQRQASDDQPSVLAGGLAIDENAGRRHILPAQLGLSAMKRVVPVIGAYTRLPLMSRRNQFRGWSVQAGTGRGF